MLDTILHTIKKFIPTKLFGFFQPTYHWVLAFSAGALYRFPSRKIKVVGVTGTKGKTSTVELISAILEEAGFKTALSSTLRIKVGKKSKRNMYKMTMPGRFFMQKHLRKAVSESCDYVIIEMTSEGAKYFRHKFISLDALVFTNLTPEHIESHGSFKKYREAKLSLARSLEKSRKKSKVIVANTDDKEGASFLDIGNVTKKPFSLKDMRSYNVKTSGLDFTWDGVDISSHLSGEFNLYNILAAITLAGSQGISTDVIKKSVEKFKGIRGRVEKIEEGQDFSVIVDYAHTIDSLEKLYDVFAHTKKICVLGNTGGGRDKWKREGMAKIAEKHCEHVILTDEDPYDEDPRKIVDQMFSAIKSPIAEIVMDRREAIAEAFSHAKTGDTVLITGKGTDPYIMGANNTKTPWDDATVAREELKKLVKNK